MSLVYAFAHGHERAPTELKDLLGGKGPNLAEMTSVLGLPVPPGFTITTDACRAYLDFKRLYRRRNDAESINRALDDTL